MISKSKLEGLFLGMKIVFEIFISHLLFVDDVIFLGKDLVEEWNYMHTILKVLCYASGMELSSKKSVLYRNRISEVVRDHIGFVFNYKMELQERGFKHISFF